MALFFTGEDSKLAAYPLEFLDKGDNLLEHTLLFRQVFRVEWAHFRQDAIQIRAVFAGIFPL